MKFVKVVAIIRTFDLEKVEKSLREKGVRAMTITCCSGFGEYMNYFDPNKPLSHSKIEIFTPEDKEKEIVQDIVEAVHTGSESDGIVVTLPVLRAFHIRNKQEL